VYEPTASNSLDVRGAEVSTTTRIYAELLQLHPRRRKTLSSFMPRLEPRERRTSKEKAHRGPKESSGRMFFSVFTSPE
jgi:hypothetical protein